MGVKWTRAAHSVVLTCYQLSCCGWHDGLYFTKTCQLTVNKLENETMSYKETVEQWHLVFCPGSQRMVHCRITTLVPNRRVSVNEVSLSVSHLLMNWLIHCITSAFRDDETIVEKFPVSANTSVCLFAVKLVTLQQLTWVIPESWILTLNYSWEN
jgi:hypothetical protein